MSRILGFLSFFLLFIGIYGGMNWHVFSRMFGFFNLQKNWWYLGLILFFSFSYLISSFLIKVSYNAFTKWFYVAAASWFGIVFFAFFAVIIVSLINMAWPIDTKTAGIAVIAVVFVVSAISFWNATNLKAETITLSMDGLDEPVSIVHLSDIHIGTINTVDYMKRLVEMTNGLDPDIVMITGDMFDSSAPINPSDYKPLDDIEAPVLFTMGNHEFYEGIDQVMHALSMTDVRILRDEEMIINGIQVIGLDDPAGSRSIHDQMDGIQVRKDIPTVLMYHQPRHAGFFSSLGIDLHLAGHTHNGQIFPFNIIVRMFYPFISGLYVHEGMYIYTSPGSGTWGPPMRLGSTNTITRIRLEVKP